MFFNECIKRNVDSKTTYEARNLKKAGINVSRAIIGKSILFICVSLLISVSLSVAESQPKEMEKRASVF